MQAQQISRFCENIAFEIKVQLGRYYIVEKFFFLLPDCLKYTHLSIGVVNYSAYNEINSCYFIN